MHHPIIPRKGVPQVVWLGLCISPTTYSSHLLGHQRWPGGRCFLTSPQHLCSRGVALIVCLCRLPRFLGALIHLVGAKPHHRVRVWSPPMLDATQLLLVQTRRMILAPYLVSFAQGVGAGIIAVVLRAPAEVFATEALVQMWMTQTMVTPLIANAMKQPARAHP